MKLDGYVKSYLKKPVQVNFNIYSDTFDSFIAEKILKLEIGTCKNLHGYVNLAGKLTDKLRLTLKSGKITFKNSNVNFYNYIFHIRYLKSINQTLYHFIVNWFFINR